MNPSRQSLVAALFAFTVAGGAFAQTAEAPATSSISPAPATVPAPSFSPPGAPPAPAGPREFRVHDPSAILREGDTYWSFSTGVGVNSLHSKDLVTWERGPRVFEEFPAWHREVVPEQKGHLWAPDLIKQGERYLLYYSVSKFGVNTSAIGLATSPTLDPSRADYRWKDEGIVVRSRKEDAFNAIDPAVFRDNDGRLWLTFGSFWSGIKLIELDPATGKRLAPDSPQHALASYAAIEAPAIHRRGDDYYLFVNWGVCCRGVDSTYEIRVGRSRSIIGPYRDRDGVDLLKGGGTQFLATAGTMIGPGHVGIFPEKGREWLSIHFYDATQKGRSLLAVMPLTWTDDGWPVAALSENIVRSLPAR